MEEQYNDENRYHNEEESEIDIMEYVRKALKNWKFILKCCGVGAVLGLVIAFSTPKTYTTSASMAPEITSKSSGSSLSSLASLAGINLGSMSSSDAMSPDFYPDVVTSTPFVVDLFSTPVDFKYKKENMESDLYTYLKEYNKKPWWGFIMSAPMKALGWCMSLLHEKKEKVEGYADINPEELTDEQEKIAKAIRESISCSVDKKTYCITITAKAQSPHVAQKLAAQVIQKLQDYVTDYRTGKARQDLEYYQQLFDESQKDYYTAQQRYASYTDRNQGVVLQSVKTESERLQNEMNLAYTLYNSCAQQLQIAKANVAKERPVIKILEPPTVPLKGEPSKLKTLVIWIFLGLLVGAVWVCYAKDWIAGLKQSGSESEPEESKS